MVLGQRAMEEKASRTWSKAWFENERAGSPVCDEKASCGWCRAGRWIRLGFVLILSRNGMVWAGAPSGGPA